MADKAAHGMQMAYQGKAKRAGVMPGVPAKGTTMPIDTMGTGRKLNFSSASGGGPVQGKVNGGTMRKKQNG